MFLGGGLGSWGFCGVVGLWLVCGWFVVGFLWLVCDWVFVVGLWLVGLWLGEMEFNLCYICFFEKNRKT